MEASSVAAAASGESESDKMKRSQTWPDTLRTTVSSKRAKLNVSEYHQVVITPTRHHNEESIDVSRNMLKALNLRAKYQFQRRVHEGVDPIFLAFRQAVRESPFTPIAPPLPNPDPSPAAVAAGGVWDEATGLVRIGGVDVSPHDYVTFSSDLSWLYFVNCLGKKENSFAARRIELLELAYRIHTTLNHEYEVNESKDDSADFGTIMKVCVC